MKISKTGISAMNNSAHAEGLTGQRNEESVLFSLRSFPAMRSAPSSRAPASEGSGLIDIRAMRALIDDDTSASAATHGAGKAVDTIPSFGGGGLGAVSVQPLAPEPSPHVSTTEPRPRGSTTPLYTLIVVLGLGVLGLGTAVLLDEPPVPVVTREVITVPGAVADNNHGEAEPQDHAGQLAHAAVVETPAATEPEPEPTKPKHNKPKHNNAKHNNTTKPTSAAAASPTKATDKVDVDCLLNQKLPKCQGKTDTKAPAPTTAAPAPTTELAKKLDQSQILAGIGPVKTAAKSCGSGTTVTMKFSVKGSTGAVISAHALDEHASSTIGKCVEKSAAQAKFAKFAAEQQGFSFKFRL